MKWHQEGWCERLNDEKVPLIYTAAIVEILRHAGNISWSYGHNLKAILRSPNNPSLWWAEVHLLLLFYSLLGTLPVDIKILWNSVFILDSMWKSFSEPVYLHVGLLVKFCEVNVSPSVNTWVLACHCEHCASWSWRLNNPCKKLLPRPHQKLCSALKPIKKLSRKIWPPFLISECKRS